MIGDHRDQWRGGGFELHLQLLHTLRKDLALFVLQAFLQPLYFVSKPFGLARGFILVLSDLPLPLLNLQIKRLLLLLKLFDLALR